MINKKQGNPILYALREIVLIIAGILIAVQINNWNAHRNLLHQANRYIADVKKDLELDTAIFNSTIKKIDLKIDYKKRLLQPDSLVKLSTRNIQAIFSTGTNNIAINNSTYQKIKEAGILTLNEKSYLFKKFDNYYANLNNYLKEFNKWEETAVRKDFYFWVYQDKFELEYFDSIFPKHKSTKNRKRLLDVVNSIEGRNYLNMAVLREETMKKTYVKIRDYAEKLLKGIDSIQGVNAAE